MDRRQNDVRIISAKLLVPIAGIAGAAQPVDGHACDGKRSRLAACDALDRAQNLANPVRGPCTRFGDYQSPVGRKKAVDGKQAERWWTVDDDEIVLDAREGNGEAVVGADRIGEQL